MFLEENSFLDFVHFEGMLSEVHGQANAHVIPFLFLSTLLFISSCAHLHPNTGTSHYRHLRHGTKQSYFRVLRSFLDF